LTPPFDLLLNMMEPDEHPSEIVSPLHELILERFEDTVISRDDLLRILRLRAAGKTISVLFSESFSHAEPVDVVEYWKDTYDIGEEW
jgi:hypothetical protein